MLQAGAMATYLVTGGAGFIGSSLATAILERGDRVRILDDLSTGRAENLEPLRGRAEIIEGSVVDPETCARAAAGVDYVLHQAAIPSVQKSLEIPAETNRVNVGGTLNMLIAARDAKVKRFVYAASSSAYGDTPTMPKIESMPPLPKSPYAVQKLAGEMYCRAFHTSYGLETVALRYFNIFGPRQDPSSPYSAVIPLFAAATLKGKAPVIYGDGKQTRDFTYIDNVVQANLAACHASSEAAGQVVNVACAERVDLNELARVVREIVGSGPEPRYEAPRVGDVMHSLADISAAERLIGYKPAVKFREGVERTIAWYRAENG